MLTIPNFLDEPARLEVLAAMRSAAARPAVVYIGDTGTLYAQIRRTTDLQVDIEIRALIEEMFDRRMAEIARHFGADVNEVEDAQFLRYQIGDYFVAHQDGNTPLIRSKDSARRVSLVLFLSDRDDYDGGELVFHVGNNRQAAVAEPGSLLAFRAETTHEVTPLTRGERFTIVSWYR